MRKILEKVSAIVLIALAFIFVTFVLLITFGALDVATLNNQLVMAMIVIMTLLFIASSVVLCWALFGDRDVIRSLLLFSDKASSTKASLSVIRKIVKENSNLVVGVKVTKILVIQEDNGFRLRIGAEVVSNDVQFSIDQLKLILVDAFKSILGVKFNSIDFKVAKLATDYKVDTQVVTEQAEQLKEQRKVEETAKLLEEQDEEVAVTVEIADEVETTNKK